MGKKNDISVYFMYLTIVNTIYPIYLGFYWGGWESRIITCCMCVCDCLFVSFSNFHFLIDLWELFVYYKQQPFPKYVATFHLGCYLLFSLICGDYYFCNIRGFNLYRVKTIHFFKVLASVLRVCNPDISFSFRIR